MRQLEKIHLRRVGGGWWVDLVFEDRVTGRLFGNLTEALSGIPSMIGRASINTIYRGTEI